MKFVCVAVFLALLAIGSCKKIKVYVKVKVEMGMGCASPPKTDSEICNIPHKIVRTQPSSFEAGAIKQLLAKFGSGANKTCTDAMNALTCSIFFPKCEGGKMFPNESIANDTCDNKMENGDQCPQSTLKLFLEWACQSAQKSFDTKRKMNSQRYKCSKRSEKMKDDKFCPQVSYKVGFYNDSNVIEEQQKFKETLEKQVKMNATESCYNNLKEVFCAISYPYCENDKSMVVAFPMNKEDCEEKVKCYKGMNVTLSKYCEAFPLKNASTLNIDIGEDKSGQQLITMIPFVSFLLGLLAFYIA